MILHTYFGLVLKKKESLIKRAHCTLLYLVNVESISECYLRWKIKSSEANMTKKTRTNEPMDPRLLLQLSAKK